MRNLLSIFVLLIATVAMGQTKKLHLQASNLQWEAKKVVGAAHQGTLTFSSGEFTYKNNELIGGSFVVDMNTLTVTDEGMDAKGKAKHPKCNSPHRIDVDEVMENIAEVLRKIAQYSLENKAEFEKLVKESLYKEQTDYSGV